MNRLLKWIRVKILGDYKACYIDRENEGNASMGKCRGLVGGDKHTDYLQYGCIDCPYHTFIKEVENE